MPLPVLFSDRLCGERAAQAEAEVERSESEDEAQGRSAGVRGDGWSGARWHRGPGWPSPTKFGGRMNCL